MSKKIKNVINNKISDEYYEFKDGFISYNPQTLTESYTVKEFKNKKI